MKKLLIILLTLYSFICFSQVSLKQLPKITIDDFESISCEIDSSAKAQIIYDIGNTYFWVNNERIEHVFEKTTRIQILNKSGYDYATIDIPFYVGSSGKEELVDFTATSYNFQDGEIISETVNEKALYEDEINQWWKRKKYAFTKVKEGTIIEYSYKISSPYNVHLRTWFFQHDIPVLKSKYKFSACPYYNYIVLSKGFLKFDIDTVYTEPFGFRLLGQVYKTRVYEWELNNVPAFKDESFVPSDDEYKMKVEFQLESYHGIRGGKFELMTTWQQLIEELLEETASFGGYIKSGKSDAQQILSELTLNGKTDFEKVLAILNYVKNNFYWNSYNGIYATQTKKKFIESKSGNVADINLFLHALLNEAEIESSPILISTRSHGKVYYQYPFLNLFNYVAVMFTDETGNYFIDATNPLLPLGILPKECINEYGLQIKKVKKGEDAQFYPLSPTKVDLTKQHQTFSINQADNIIEGKTQVILDGYKALDLRHRIKQDGIESIKQNMTNQTETEISELEVENLDIIEDPLVLKYTAKKNIVRIGNKVFIAPFSNNSFKENILRQQNRIYPVDYGILLEEQLYFTISIPPDYEIDYIPESHSFKNAELKLEFSYIVQRIESSLQIMVKVKRYKVKYEPSEYKELKAFNDMIVKYINENIVLKKI
jgi:hypothetical protein